MHEFENWQQTLLIYNPQRKDFPNPPRPNLSPQTQAELGTWLGVCAARAATNPTVNNLCELAVLQWNIGDEQGVRDSNRLWKRGRQRREYTPTLENDVSRYFIQDALEINETELAWRTLRRVVRRMRDEPLQRQGFSAYLASEIALAEKNIHLRQLFAANADVIWRQALAAGERVDRGLVLINCRSFMPREKPFDATTGSHAIHRGGHLTLSTEEVSACIHPNTRPEAARQAAFTAIL